MMLVSKTYWAGMPFWFRKTPPDTSVESLVLRAHDLRQLRALYWSSEQHRSPRVGVVLMHPRVDFTHHYAIPRLLDSGFAVIAATTRHGTNDTYAEHEEMVLDVGACVRHLRERRGVERVVLFGNSGGGSLMAYYQAVARSAAAERPTRSPGGTSTHFETAPLTPADAMVYVAVHRGQGKLLLGAIDPSVTDELDPLSIDEALDLYDERNGFREPPASSEYDEAFLERYRAAQVLRVRRIDAAARAMIARQNEAAEVESDPSFGARPFAERRDVLRRRACEPLMVIYRTMANPAYVDRNIDPSNRDYGSLLSERPDLMNYAALGFARTCTPRAWLSTWSGLSSRADLVINVGKITEPSLLVTASRDREVFPQDGASIFRAMASTDKSAIMIDARHYFEPDLGERQTPDVDRLMDVVVPWIRERVS
jgi:hypothetical protein